MPVAEAPGRGSRRPPPTGIVDGGHVVRERGEAIAAQALAVLG